MAIRFSFLTDLFEAFMNRRIIKQSKVYWLYGLSGAGKTTLAMAAVRAFNTNNYPAVILDGDQLRLGLCQDLGFSLEDRLENVRRTAEIAKLLCDQGFMVLAALMTPQENMRRLACNIVGKERFNEVYLKCDFSICAQRDPKGLYASATVGKLRHFPGQDMVFEEPKSPHLVLDTANHSIEVCIQLLWQQITPSLPNAVTNGVDATKQLIVHAQSRSKLD